jgi:hypothetical protein
MNNYMEIKDLKTPQYIGITNNIEYARNTKNKGILFEYFKQCNNNNVEWGSNKPIKGIEPNKIKMSGESCNNIWNNSTKRKIIVK